MFLKIRCDSCHQSWEVYEYNLQSGSAVRTCPHCDAVMQKETYDQVISTFLKAKRVNERFAADSVNKNAPLFAVSFIEDRPFACPVADIDIENIDVSID